MVFRCRAAGLGLAILVATAWPGTSYADPIVYTEQAIATGTLGQYDFIDALVTITVAADTAGVAQTPGGLIYNVGQGSVSVAGLGTGSFLDPLAAFAFAGAIGTTLGITDTSPLVLADLLDTSLPAGFSYDLSTFLAPVTGASLVSPNASFATTSGDLTLFLAGSSSFSATTEDVPEPASIATLCGALALLLILRGAVANRFTEPLR